MKKIKIELNKVDTTSFTGYIQDTDIEIYGEYAVFGSGDNLRLVVDVLSKKVKNNDWEDLLGKNIDFVDLEASLLAYEEFNYNAYSEDFYWAEVSLEDDI